MSVDIAELGLSVDSKGVVRANRELKKLDKTSGKAEKSAARMGKAFGLALGAFATGKLFQSAISNTIEQEAVTAQLEQTLRSTGRYTPELSKSLQDYASHLQTVTTYGDEAIVSSQAMLLTFTRIGGEAFPRAQEAILDVATAMKTDLKSAAIQVGKALNDPKEGLTALSRSGITFSETQKQMVKDFVATNQLAKAQALILTELETQFGGSARAAKDTLGGAMKSLKNSFGDLLEGEGGSTEGVIDSINELTDLLNSQEIKQGFATFTQGVFGITSFAAKAVVRLKTLSEWVDAIFGGKRTVNVLEDQLSLAEDKVITLTQKFENATEAYDKMEIAGELKEAKQQMLGLIKQIDSLREVTAAPFELKTVNALQSSDVGQTKIGEKELKFADDLAAKLRKADQDAIDGYAKIKQAIFDERSALYLTDKELLINQKLSLLSADATGAMKTEIETLTGSLYEEAKAFEVLAEQEQIQKDRLAAMAEQAKGWASDFADAMVSGEGSFAGFAKSVIEQLQKIAIQQATEPLFGAFGGLLDDVFGGFLGGGSGAFGGVGALPTGGGAIHLSRTFEGGGFTGAGSRSGGLDGKGGFPAMLHPNETVIDHTKSNSLTGASVTVNVDAKGTSVEGNNSQSKKLGKAIGNSVRAILVQEQRPNGILYR